MDGQQNIKKYRTLVYAVFLCMILTISSDYSYVEARCVRSVKSELNVLFILSIIFNLHCSVLWPRLLSPTFHCGGAGSVIIHSMLFWISVSLLFIRIVCFSPVIIVPPVFRNHLRHNASLSDGKTVKEWEPSSKTMHFRKSGIMRRETTSTLSFPRINL